MKLRFGIRSLLIACALVAAFFPFCDFYEQWFRSSYSGYHVHKALGDYVTDGDSFEHVSSLFDRFEPRTKQWIQEHGPVLANQKSIFLDHKKGDEYYLFFINGGNVRAVFQFRNDVVVNHLDGNCQSPYSTVQHYKDSSPHSLLRHGVLPAYAVVVVACGATIWLVLTFVIPRQSTAV